MATQNIDLSVYLPAIADIPSARVLTARASLANYLAQQWPDLDTRPGSVDGDLRLTPFAYLMAACEMASERVISDLDLEQIANGVVYSCPVAQAFVNNFYPAASSAGLATGVVRLTFSQNLTVSLDQKVMLLFGTSSVFALMLAAYGPLEVLPVGSVRRAPNQAVLVSTGTSYFVDVPVVGVMPTQVAAGDTASIDKLPANLTSITAIASFFSDAGGVSLSKQASMAKNQMYSASLTSRGGAAALVRSKFPDIAGVSAVVSGDVEMLRDTVNPLGFRDGRLDVLAKTGTAYTSSTLLVRVPYDSENEKFIGRLGFPDVPILIDGITAQAAPAVSLTRKIYSRSLDPVRAPLATCAYSVLEDLWIAIDMPKDGDHLPLIQLETDGTNYWAWFSVVYRSDPAVKKVEAALGTQDAKPIGVDVLVKRFTPVVISSLVVEYAKASGKQVNITQAKAEILATFASLSFPDVYMDSYIGDSMLYAGATGVKRLSCVASVRWSVADVFLPDSAPALDINFSTADSAALTPPSLSFTSPSALVPDFVDPQLGTSEATMVALGSRNVGYVLDAANIDFAIL